MLMGPMRPLNPLQLAAEFRRRAEAASGAEKADLLFLADEYEAVAAGDHAEKHANITVKLPI